MAQAPDVRVRFLAEGVADVVDAFRSINSEAQRTDTAIFEQSTGFDLRGNEIMSGHTNQPNTAATHQPQAPEWVQLINKRRGKTVLDNHGNYLCDGCGETIREYAAEDSTWRAAGLTLTSNVCLPCLRKRLGRPLTLFDFKKDFRGRDIAPVNRWLHFQITELGPILLALEPYNLSVRETTVLLALWREGAFIKRARVMRARRDGTRRIGIGCLLHLESGEVVRVPRKLFSNLSCRELIRADSMRQRIAPWAAQIMVISHRGYEALQEASQRQGATIQ